MKYLITVETADGEHEYRDHAIIEAKDEVDALKVGNQCVEAGEGEYFGYGDGLTLSRLRDVRAITPEQAKVLDELGLVYEITTEGMRTFKHEN